MADEATLTPSEAAPVSAGVIARQISGFERSGSRNRCEAHHTPTGRSGKSPRVGKQTQRRSSPLEAVLPLSRHLWVAAKRNGHAFAGAEPIWAECTQNQFQNTGSPGENQGLLLSAQTPNTASASVGCQSGR